jgi:hypothetical protein
MISKYFMAVFAVAFVTFSVFSSNSFGTPAQPVPIPEDQSLSPQVEISGVGVGTLGASKAQGFLNFSDSALFIGAAERLGEGDGIGSMGLGWLTLEDTNQGLATQLFLHQGFVDFQSKNIEVLIGRSDNPTAHLVDFPTIRGDDLITLTNPLNPFSDGKNSEEHRYSNVASVTINQGLKYFESFHAQHLINSSGVGSQTGINSFGAHVEYLSTPGMEAFTTVPSWGFGVEHFVLRSDSTTGLNEVYFGGTLNLNESVTKRWDLKFQDIAGFGSDLKKFNDITDSFQANSNTLTASISYLSTPFGGMGYQLAILGAYKNYFDIENATSYGGGFTAVKRLGQGFDMVAQYLGQFRNAALASVQSNGTAYEQIVEIGFVFNMSATINRHLAPRRSILNQQHEYIPN